MRLACIVAAFAGCFHSNEVLCEDGRVCPEQTVCLLLTAGEAVPPPEQAKYLRCGRVQDIDACREAAEFDPCGLAVGGSGACYRETGGGLVCQPTGCGNSIVDPDEVCDDGNAVFGDGCSHSCRSNETCGNGRIDPLRLVAGTPVLNEVCDDATAIGRDGCSSGCQIEAPRWQSVSVSASPALARHRMTYDPIRRRIVMFGGTSNNRDAYNDTWEWDGAGWSTVKPLVAPSSRVGPAFVAGPDGVLLFGGSSGDQATGDLWTWDGDSWTALSFASGPSAWADVGSAYDARRKRLVIYGAAVGQGSETWAWDGQTWSEIATPPALQPPRTAVVMGFDPSRATIVMAGGRVRSGGVEMSARETWELDGATWTLTGAVTPDDLIDAAMAYDPVGKRMLVYGGTPVGPNLAPLARTLAWDGQQWSELGQAAPGPLRRAAIATDPIRGQVVMHGGLAEAAICNACQASSETWIWDGSQWTLAAAPLSPGKRSYATAAYDPDRQTLVMFGGVDDAPAPATARGDTWELRDGHWSLVATTGPAPRLAASMAYDAARRQMVLFGGRPTSGSPSAPETWLWNGTAWSRAAPSTSPPPRANGAMAYDVARGRTVLYGGTTPSDTWEWDGTNWEVRMPAQTPPDRSRHALAYDPVSRTVLAFGGLSTENGLTSAASDTWAWDGTTWTSAAPSGPVARFGAKVEWNPARRRLTLFGGGTIGGTALDDTWEWDGAAWRQVFTSSAPLARVGHVVFPAPDGTGVFVFGGTDSTSTGTPPASFGDLWRLTYANEQPYEQCAVGVDRDRDGLSGCDDPDCGHRCAPFCVADEIGTPACPSTGSRCGDGTCDQPRETCRMCPEDCGVCVGVCGDGFCDPAETCLGDCP